MAVRIRLKKMGRRHRPYYRIVAADSRAKRDGRVLEVLGQYDPLAKELHYILSLCRCAFTHCLSVLVLKN